MRLSSSMMPTTSSAPFLASSTSRVSYYDRREWTPDLRPSVLLSFSHYSSPFFEKTSNTKSEIYSRSYHGIPRRYHQQFNC